MRRDAPLPERREGESEDDWHIRIAEERLGIAPEDSLLSLSPEEREAREREAEERRLEERWPVHTYEEAAALMAVKDGAWSQPRAVEIAPWAELEDSPNKRAAAKWWGMLREGEILLTNSWPRATATRGRGLLLVGEDAEDVARSVLAEVIRDRGIGYPFRDIRRFPFKKHGARTVRAVDADLFLRISRRENAGERDLDPEVLDAMPWHAAAVSHGHPDWFLLLLGLDRVRWTEWSGHEVAQLLRSRAHLQGVPTVIACDRDPRPGMPEDTAHWLERTTL